MLRSLIISLSRVDWAQSAIMKSSLAWRMTRRFVAGVEPEAAIQAALALNKRDIAASLDHLGENTLQIDDADQATSTIMDILYQIKSSGVDATLSVKLTQIGLGIDEQLCRENLLKILEKAKDIGLFIRIDMEESKYVDQTLALYKEMGKLNFENLGIVIQSYLYRSEADINALQSLHPKVRLCKGAYKEDPSRAFPDKKDVDRNYDHLMQILFDSALLDFNPGENSNRGFPPIPAIATHDVSRINHAISYAEKINLPREAFEFQMLYGIRSDLQEDLAKKGYRVRVYIPFGIRWYPYLMRRLAERPANLWFFLSNLLRNQPASMRAQNGIHE